MLASAFAAGCSNDNVSYEDTDAFKEKDDRTVTGAPVVRFSPANSELPFPTDILFSDTKDGSINIPGTATNGKVTAPTNAQAADPQVALNTMDGFSTISPASFTVTAEVDATTLKDNVRVFQTDTSVAFNATACLLTGSCTGFDAGSKTTWSLAGSSRELVNGLEYTVSSSPNGEGGTTVAILPLKPLAPSSTFVVAVGNEIELAAGDNTVGPDVEYRLLKQAEPLFYLSTDIAADIGETKMQQIAGVLSAPPPAGTGIPAATIQAALTARLGLGTNPNPAATNNSCVITAQVLEAIKPALTATSTPVSFDPSADCTATVDLLDSTDKAISFEKLRLQTSTQEAAVSAFAEANVSPNSEEDPKEIVKLPAENIIGSFSFSTQDVGSVLKQAQLVAATELVGFPPSPGGGTLGSTAGLLTATSTPGLDNKGDQPFIDAGIPKPSGSPVYLADVFTGTLAGLPQFIGSDKEALTTVWKADSTKWADQATFEQTFMAQGDAPAVATAKATATVEACEAGLGANVNSENLVQCNAYRPKLVAAANVPIIVTVPNAAAQGSVCAAATDYPVVIYQHGITSNRGTLLAMANTLASQCLIGVAIDMPQHGVLSAADCQDFYESGTPERQSCLQFSPFHDSNNERLVTGKTSGEGFVNLGNLANARDSIRQAVTDLNSLNTILSGLDSAGALDAYLGVDANTAKTHFVGMSLGAIVGTPFIANANPAMTSAVLNVGGGGIAKLLDGSPTFEPRITQRLAANGIAKPSGRYESFLVAAQTLLDNTDPINFAEKIVSNGTPVLFQEVIADQVVPNNVFGTSDLAPAFGAIHATPQTGFLKNQNPVTVPGVLSGSDPLAVGTSFAAVAAKVQAGETNPAVLQGTCSAGFTGLNLKPVGATPGAESNIWVRFTSGSHSSLLDPTDGLDVTTTMQTQMVGLLAMTVELMLVTAMVWY
ncbi:conserved hypothetical protein [gamma proteobacterium HTCC5015]|nr:conserved hypothetical protein [gamma proteobacterium HTCC5015]